MKKFLLIVFAILLSASCSLDDATTNYYSLEVLPIESATVPMEMELGETYTINYSYIKPTDCHVFNDLYHNVEGNIHTIAVTNLVANNDNCQVVNAPLEDSFSFFANTNNSLIEFKFWHGVDVDGNDTYLTYEVPVID